MSATHSTESFQGTMDEVASFFGVDVRTVKIWKSDTDPKTKERKEIEIGFWEKGRSVIIPETAVVELYVKRYRAARPMAAADAQEQARREWREHLRLVRGEPLSDHEARIHAIEEKLGIQPRSPEVKVAA